MKRKNIFTLFTAAALCITALTGCAFTGESSNSQSSDSEGSKVAEKSETTEASTAETATQATTSTENQDYSDIDNMISKMTVEEKVGQLFYVNCRGADMTEAITEYHIGGVLLFGADFEGKTKSEVVATNSQMQSLAKIPLIIGTDEEGGTVVRASSNSNLRDEPYLSPSDTFSEGGWSAIEDDAYDKAEFLLSLGVNVNMAPVCDITSDPDAFMYYRSFSSDVDYACRFVDTVVSASKDKQLGTVLKHFPGYGNNGDTHTYSSTDGRTFSDLQENDFLPFKSGIDAGADSILVSHLVVNCMDSKNPASLSSAVNEVIRDTLDFDGVIMTDDLEMAAVSDLTTDEALSVMAVKAGNDFLCCGDIDTEYNALFTAVKNGEISTERIEQSVKRILIWKKNLGIL